MDSWGSRVPPSSIFIFFFIFIFAFRINPSSSVQVCQPARCNNQGWAPEIRFPFRLIRKQDERCGYPGFDLSCNSLGQTILNLPLAGEYVVNGIEYSTQSILINDPGSCLPNRIPSFNVSGSAFRPASSVYFKVFNCSLDWTAYNDTDALPVLCSGGSNSSTMLAVPSRYAYRRTPPSSCTLLPMIPLRLTITQYWPNMAVEDENLELTWSQPDCRNCEFRGLDCGFQSDTSLDIGCSDPPTATRTGLSRGAKYGLILGVGLPGLVCLIGLLCYVIGKFSRRSRQDRHLDSQASSSSIAAMIPPPISVTISGLDAPTIESYPKTVIGESRRLPNLCDGTCPICLSEYQPQETLRSIPECNHYFHAGCIDEWLRLKGSCPLCRNSPETKLVTPRSSQSSAFSTSSSSSSA